MSYQKMSRLYAPTLKEDPTEAQVASHRLLLRAGMIRKTASGLYSYLPFAWRSILKIEQIIREELEAIGSLEMMTPHITPAELWHKSGRWDVYGPELMRLEDRHEREFALGPTHEETFTDLISSELRSYKQLPVTLWQIQDKFRDELRPRFGLMRGREFIMEDSYSFCATQESLQECYDEYKEAYSKIFARCGLKCLPVVADSGQIGGDTSVEFMALADAGEASLVWCDCGFAANDEAALCKIDVVEGPGSEMEKIETPCEGSIEALAEFMGVEPAACRKSVALVAEDGTYVLAIVPGDHELNEVKAEHLFGEYTLMTEEQLKEAGLVEGYMGPVGAASSVRIVADESLKDSKSWLVGANEAGYHIKGACPGRDFEVDEFADIIVAKPGDTCCECGRKLKGARGIEVGQVFQLGTKYSEAMGATFMDENGREKPFIMGCYGIGVSRTLAAVVEQANDEAGIVWPVSVAPYEVEVLALDIKGEECMAASDKIARELSACGLEVVLDDRKERPGIKFNDADLYGFPVQIICSKRSVADGKCEVKVRKTGERFEMNLEEVVAWTSAFIQAEKVALNTF